MKMLIGTLILGLTLSGAALADNNSQQNRMKTCNTQATGMSGDARKTFMKTCLSGQTSADAPVDKNGKALTPQQIKMKNCAAANKGKKGDDYKTAQAACMAK